MVAQVGAGNNWDGFVRQCVDDGLVGIEIVSAEDLEAFAQTNGADDELTPAEPPSARQPESESESGDEDDVEEDDEA